MRIRRPSAAATAVLLAILAAQGGVGAASAPASRPDFVKSCRSIKVSGRVLGVDITEVIGRPRGRCATGRTVMRRFLHTGPVYEGPNSREIRFRGRTYDCYASRPDGEGWDYHCNWLKKSGDTFVDYGAGRRF